MGVVLLVIIVLLLYSYRDELKEILREVKRENNDSLAHIGTDQIVLAVREKIAAKIANQMPSTTKAPTVFPSAFPSQSQVGVSTPGVGVSTPGVGVSTGTTPGSVLLPMAQTVSMWNNVLSQRPPQPSVCVYILYVFICIYVPTYIHMYMHRSIEHIEYITITLM